jgi:hypothetical protein
MVPMHDGPTRLYEDKPDKLISPAPSVHSSTDSHKTGSMSLVSSRSSRTSQINASMISSSDPGTWQYAREKNRTESCNIPENRIGKGSMKMNLINSSDYSKGITDQVSVMRHVSHAPSRASVSQYETSSQLGQLRCRKVKVAMVLPRFLSRVWI